ncbi:MAG: DNA -binding domain-containing protein [Janthinobacterium lividum]
MAPSAGYLYVVHLDQLSLAWEYLRRNPDYQHDWHAVADARQSPERWGLHAFESPYLDALDARPMWTTPSPSIVEIHALSDAHSEADTFDLWRIPGKKHLLHDGARLLLTSDLCASTVRFALTRDVAWNVPFAYSIPAGRCMSRVWKLLMKHQRSLASSVADGWGARERPDRSALFHMHALQALDASLAGASLKQVAEALFGADEVLTGWHPDSDLRARVRRLVRAARHSMVCGYRELLKSTSV